jgi:hypothetical protein
MVRVKHGKKHGEKHMIAIAGKNYELKEITARAYQALMDRMEKEFGAEWQTRGGMNVAIFMLAVCLKSEDGTAPAEDALWDLPLSQINKLSAEATKMNGIGADEKAEIEKN